MILEDKFISRIYSPERRYYISKTIYVLYLAANFVAIWIIWVEDIQTLLLGFGLVAAAFTISLQDLAKNFVGGLSIYFNNIYRVGDRIEVSSKKGDVIDINILYTKVMEINEWISGDQHTGRISSIPNSWILTNTVNNYSKDFNFLWDEIVVPITYDSDWAAARALILDIIIEESSSVKEYAEGEIFDLERKYYISKGSTDAEVYLRLTDNWVEFSARYVTPVRRRREMRNKISRRILEGVDKAEKIKIASQTFDIVGFPEVKLKANIDEAKGDNPIVN